MSVHYATLDIEGDRFVVGATLKGDGYWVYKLDHQGGSSSDELRVTNLALDEAERRGLVPIEDYDLGLTRGSDTES